MSYPGQITSHRITSQSLTDYHATRHFVLEEGLKNIKSNGPERQEIRQAVSMVSCTLTYSRLNKGVNL